MSDRERWFRESALVLQTTVTQLVKQCHSCRRLEDFREKMRVVGVELKEAWRAVPLSELV